MKIKYGKTVNLINKNVSLKIIRKIDKLLAALIEERKKGKM